MLQSERRLRDVLYVDQVDFATEQLAAFIKRVAISPGTPSNGTSEYKPMLLNFLVAELDGLNKPELMFEAVADRIYEFFD